MLGIPKAEMSFGYIKIGTYLPLDKTSPQPESVCLRVSGVCPLFGSTEDRAYLIAPVERLAVIYRYLLIRLCTHGARGPNLSHGLVGRRAFRPQRQERAWGSAGSDFGLQFAGLRRNGGFWLGFAVWPAVEHRQ